MTFSVDFDKVIHAYSKGWHNGKIYDEELPGAFYALDRLMREDSAFVLTTRNPREVARWIERMSSYTIDCTTKVPRTWYGRRKPFWNKRGVLLVTNWKLAANIYIDDRGYHFENWNDTLLDLGIENYLKPKS